ncbi:tyrosine-type recombinase/integrase [Desulfoluna spongiiphila]|uniref:tyrosine-type recombinase/integrase n=1 Tax=Desulfoluna spongiiphila TaxID=419481 RepID=UPI001253A97D|nr:integrase arm-type DNA-binding domain-containing protein [Desulfoluna spongiiphila]VVS92226.1 consensus disorder prediction [Desulfoluna spongiiphila]
MPLTDTAIRNAQPKDKPYKMTDEKGLYLLVKTKGKYFRYDYRYGGKRKTMALGVYPEVKLKAAREKRDQARKLLDNGIDPMAHAKTAKALAAETAANSFEAVAFEWFAKYKNTWVEGHSRTIIRRLEMNVFPWIGAQGIETITAPDVLAVLRRIEERGALETAHRVKQVCGQVFRYAIATGRADRDPSADLKGALPPTKPTRMPTITDPSKISELLRAMDGYQGHFVTRCALRLAPLVFVRPGELRHAEWHEINFEKAEWRIPAEKMKMRSPHMVPLSDQAITILKEVEPLTGEGKYVFPSLRSKDRPMSDNTILAALRRLGYSNDEMSGHGFRAMASTLLHEQGWPSDIIERQLAHAESNSVKAAYNHAQHLPERRKMMQAWADYLDTLRSGA